jgi:PAS domain S-box-containing protein
MAVGMLLAWQLATRLSGPLSALARAGRDLGAGRAVAPIRSVISEVQDVSAALSSAHDQLCERSASLAAERTRLAAIIETVPVGLLIADAAGRGVAGNRQLARMLPVGPCAANAILSLEAIDEDGRPVPNDRMPLPRALAGEDPAELRGRFRHVDGSLFWAQAVAAPFAGAPGEVTGAVLALLDIDDSVRARQQKEKWAVQLEAEVKARTSELEQTNRRLLDEVSARGRAEDQLRQAQKMEAVGRLTGGIAHDFNNLLTVILGSLELLRRRVTDGRALRLVESAADGANRAAELVRRLLAFSRRQPLLPQRLDVNQLVLGMSSLLRRSLGKTITVETVLEPDLWQAMADPNQLESALLNLAVNARDAILDTSPGGGRLRIETTSLTVERASALAGELRPGDYVVIATIDSGGGMTSETVAQAFEPFFTTKPHGKGSGLGLSQVHGFAVQSGGHVAIESRLGHGTTVRLMLPRARVDAAPGAEIEPCVAAPPPVRPGAVILWVEDEPAVLLFGAEALRLLGYEALEAGGGEQALRILADHPEIALMITDVVMPGMNGRELAREVERRRPGLPILLASGYSRGSDEPDDTKWELLPKPFTVTALAAMINTVLQTTDAHRRDSLESAGQNDHFDG